MIEVLSILYPYMVILYLADCLIPVGKQQVAFISGFSGAFRKVGTGIHFAGFWPGIRVFITGKRPFCLTGSGIYLPLERVVEPFRWSHPENYELFPYAGIDTLSADNGTINLNNSVTIKTCSDFEARKLSKRLENLKNMEYSERRTVIEAYTRNDTALSGVKAGYSRWYEKAGFLDRMSALMFACFFFLLPAGLYLIPVPIHLVYGLVAIMLTVYVVIFTAACRQWKQLYSGNRTLIFKLIVTLLLSPVSTMHISGYITRNLLSTFDSLAISALLLPQKTFNDLIRKELYFIGCARVNKDEFGWPEFWKSRCVSMGSLLKSMHLNVDDLFARPQKTETDAAGYCPVCRTEYRRGFSTCSDCKVLLEAY